MRDYTVSIVIPTFNTWKLTQDLLSDLPRNEKENIDEVVVVDDASTVTMPTLVTDLRLVYEKLKENVGFTLACNYGLVTATKPLASKHLIFLISNDVRISGKFIQQTADILFDTRRALVGNRHIVFDSGWNTFEGKTFDYLEGWFFAATNDAWVDLNYFDPNYAPYDYEDIDLSTTAKKKGYKLVSLNNPHVVHLGAGTIGFNPTREAVTRRNQEYFKSKWLK